MNRKSKKDFNGGVGRYKPFIDLTLYLQCDKILRNLTKAIGTFKDQVTSPQFFCINNCKGKFQQLRYNVSSIADVLRHFQISTPMDDEVSA